ncbi:hypothetical protein F5X97DRAFT_335758 [Nemania serpens]|nr:hypothetical protein F5X97DRAFT_335758 [Nemania serpens]
MASDARPFWDPEDSDEDINISMIRKPTAATQSSFSLPVSMREACSEAVATAPPPASVPSFNALEPLGLTFGEEFEEGSPFVPFNLVQRYLHTYFGRSDEQKVVEFFRETLPEDYTWDFFALRDPIHARTPLLLIPTSQFERYLDIANHQLDMQFLIPDDNAGDGFSFTFGKWDTPRPRFLGRAHRASDIDALVIRSHELPPCDLSHIAPDCYHHYCDKMDRIYGLVKREGKVKDSNRKREKRIRRQKDCDRMIKRVQRYLGLRQAISNMPSKSSVTTNWDVSMPAPFKPRESVRLVCVDFEAYEKDNRAITEIGLAVLDTDDLADTSPGKRGENWFSLVQAFHLRVKERSYMINTRYVRGCPEAFNFGKTQMLPIKGIAKAVGEIISDTDSEDQRPVIIVGHAVGQDLDYLSMIGYDHWDVPQIVDEIDTRAMFQRVQRNHDVPGLSTICDDLGIYGSNYHNAGNDAVYTLRAMIAMAIKRTVEGSDRIEDWLTPGTDEWTDGEMDDGGCPKRSARPVQKENVLHSTGKTRSL